MFGLQPAQHSFNSLAMNMRMVLHRKIQFLENWKFPRVAHETILRVRCARIVSLMYLAPDVQYMRGNATTKVEPYIYIYIDFWMRWVSIARHTTPHQRVWEQPARANQLARTHIRECYCDDEKHRPLYCILTFHSQFFSNNHHHIISCCRAHLGTIY